MALAVTVAMAASLLNLLPLAPAHVSSAAIPRYANIDKFVAKEVRTIIKDSAKDYLKQIKAQQGIMDLSHPFYDGQLLGSQAAESFGAFVFDLSVGTSATLAPHTLSVVMDITTGLVWAQCEPCTSCITLTPPGTSIFLPDNSDGFAEVGCATESCQSMIPAVHQCAEDGDFCDYTEDFHGAGNTSGLPCGPKLPAAWNYGAVEKALRESGGKGDGCIFLPREGQVFQSVEESYEFFNMYSWEVGFGIRYGQSRTNGANVRTRQDIVCIRNVLNDETF